MFFNKPQVDTGDLYAEPAPIDPANQASSLDVFKGYDQETLAAGNAFSSDYNLNSVYEDHNRKVKELTGKELSNPFITTREELPREDQDRLYSDYDTFRKEGGTEMYDSFTRRWVEQDYRKKLEAIAQEYPDKRSDILPDQSFLSQSYARRGEASRAAQDTWERSGKGPLDWAAWMAGSAYGAMQDPVTWLTMPFGFGGVGVGAKGLAAGVLKTGAINAAAEAVIQPSVQMEQNRAGLESGIGPAATAIGSAFLLGGALDLGIRGSFRAIAPQFGFAPVVQDGVVVAWRKPKAGAAITPDASAAMPEFDPEVMKRLDSGDIEAGKEILAQIDRTSKKTGDTVIPNALVERAASGDIEAARGIAERIAKDDPYAAQGLYGADSDALIANAPDPTITVGEHARVTNQALRAVADPANEPFPVRVAADPVLPERLPVIEKQLADLKAKADASDVETAQKIASLEAQVQMIGRFGRDPVASAEALRVNPGIMTADIDPSLPGARSAIALSKLSDDAFAQVKGGQAAPELGEMVADYVADPLMQSRVLSDLAASKPANPIEAKSRLAELLRSPEYNRTPEADAGPVATASKSPRLIDDPYGAEAKAQTQFLEQKFKEELSAEGMAPSLADQVLTPEGQAASVARASEIESVIAEFTGIAPSNVAIRGFDAISDLPPTLRAKVRQANAVRFGEQLQRFNAAKSEAERLAARTELDAASRLEGIEGIADGDTIWIASFAQNPRAKIAHEVLHSLKRTGQLRPEEEAILAAAAREAGVFSKDREALYRDAYADRSNVDELLGEEAAAHYIEAFVRGDIPASVPVNKPAMSIVERLMEFADRVREALGLKGFRAPSSDTPVDPARDVVAAILNGEVAKREMASAQSRSAMLTLRGPPEPMERPTTAAIQYKGKIATGTNHGEAFDSYLQKYSGILRRIDENDLADNAVHGFITNRGRFVDTVEAASLANKFLPADELKFSELGSENLTQFSMREDAATGQSMARDLDSLGYYSGALRAARNLRQDKGTPEQMLAMLKKEGAKDSEIEATGLNKLFGSRESAASGSDLTVTDLPEFDTSKVYYRGTTDLSPALADLEKLRRENGIEHSEPWVFLTPSRDLAAKYGDVRDFYVRKGKTLTVDNLHGSFPDGISTAAVKRLRDQGYSSIFAKEEDEFVVFDAANVRRVDGKADRNDIAPWNGDRSSGKADSAGRVNSITKSEIIEFLEKNKVGLNERQRLTERALAERKGRDYDRMRPDERDMLGINPDVAKWRNYSLDPSNPTYRETVLHLPEDQSIAETGRQVESLLEQRQRKVRELGLVADNGYDRSGRLHPELRAIDDEINRLSRVGEQADKKQFQSGHFSEPNIIGHMMTSMTSHKGKSVYTIDQIQSDWGQKLRDGGVRDEAKIAELKRRASEAEKVYLATPEGASWLARVSQISKSAGLSEPIGYRDAYSNLTTILNRRDHMGDTARSIHRASADDPKASEFRRLYAEAASAEAATTGNPLVNTTDQWTNTTLRRAIRQAAEADAEYIAIPSGETVLSYNPGDAHGMGEFYGNIVPKNLRKLLTKIDRETPAPERIDTLDSPSGKTGLGKGFTLFKLTDKVKQSVMTEGQPLFGMRQTHDVAHTAAKDKGAGEYLSAKIGHPGYGYNASGEAMLVATDPARMMDWKGREQTPEVTRALDAVGFENGISLSGKSGEKAYRALSEKLGSDELASAALLNAGIQGHKETARGFENSVVYDRSLVQRDPMTAGAAAPEGEPPVMASQLAEFMTPENLGRLADGVNAADPAQAMALAERYAPMLREYGIEPMDAMPLVQRALAGENPQALLPELMAMAPQIDGAMVKQATEVAQGMTGEASPLFAMRSDNGRIKRGAERRAKALGADIQQIEADLKASAIDQREALQRKRATFLNAQGEEAGLDDLVKYRSPRGQEDLAIGFLRMHESFGAHHAPFADVAGLRHDIANEAVGKMSEVMWELRKGALLGDLKRVKNARVRTRMENMIREAAGEKTGDAVAQRMAKAWLDTAEWLRQSFNAAGGDIQKLDGWFAPQYHDAELMLKAGRKPWVDRMMQDGVLDRARMVKRDGTHMTDGELREMLSDIWSTITTDGANKRDVTDSFGKGALYKRHAEHRVLHFKDADAFLNYAKEFGRSDPYSMMLGHIQMMARDIAALRRFGANPELVRQRLKDHIILDAKASRSARSVFDDLSDMMSDLTAKLKAIETPAEKAMSKMAEIHTKLDKMIGKPRMKAEREALRGELFKVHEELQQAMATKAETPEQKALTTQISALLDEMDQISETQPVMNRNPEQRARRILLRADEMWKIFNGSTNVPTDGNIAGAMSGVRNIISASTLVMAPISALTDQATGLQARAFVGMPVTRQLSSFIKAFTPEDRKFALRAQVGLDQAMNAFAVSTRFMGFANTAHLTGYITDRTHALSGLTPMTQAAKIGFASDFMSWMAELSKKSYGGLPSWTKDMMNRHGFTEQDFAALKTVTPEMHRGVPVLTRPAIERDAGEDVAERYMRMLMREQSQAVLEPTLQGRTAIISETKPGSIIGEISRSVAMLKSFPTSYMMLILGRFNDAYLRGKLFDSNAVAAGASILFVGTMLGALAMQMKSIAKGQDPQPMDNKEFWVRAFMQSGGLGIFGDFVANSVNRQGGSLAQTIAGPMAAEGELLMNLTIGNALDYAQGEETNAGRELTNYIRKRTPGAFVPWYFRTAYERLVLDQLQEMVDPEAHKVFRRRRQSLKKMSGNDFYWPPGQSLPSRRPDLGSVVSK